MRKLLFIAFAFFVCLNISKAQTNIYHHFPDSNAVWLSNCYALPSTMCPCCDGSCEQGTAKEDSLGGDTIIGTYKYHKLYEWGASSSFCNGPIDCSTSNNITLYQGISYIGAIRQDTNAHKVYYRPHSSSSDTLLYNFNLYVGDTLPPTYINSSNYAYVSKVDSFFIQGSYHKRFWLWHLGTTLPTPSDSGYAAIIEGMGSTIGLFQIAPLYCGSQGCCFLGCIKMNYQTIYPNPTATCGRVQTASIKQSTTKNIQFFISPNPTTSMLQITSSNEQATQLQITDVMGNELMKTTMQQGKASIDVRSFANGVYFIRTPQKTLKLFKQ